MVKNLLISFYRVNNSKPSRIIFFRDGVSEGQFREVLRFEVKGLTKSITTWEPLFILYVDHNFFYLCLDRKDHVHFFSGAESKV